MHITPGSMITTINKTGVLLFLDAYRPYGMYRCKEKPAEVRVGGV